MQVHIWTNSNSYLPGELYTSPANAKIREGLSQNLT